MLRWLRWSRAPVGLALTLTVAACTGAPRALPWEVRVPDPSLRAGVRAITASIREGSCAGREVWALSYRPSAPPDTRPPELGPGPHGFEVVAFDASCAEIARGCEEFQLPLASGSSVVVSLAASSAPVGCDPAECSDGLCGDVGGDAGRDAASAFDVGPVDARPSDAPDVARDAAIAPDAALVCMAGRTDCNYEAADGCEAMLTALTDCGACGRPCALPHATATCAAGSCAVASCAPGWDDCNGMAADGCERSLETTADCQTCGTSCSLAHAVASCGAAGCEIASCHAGWDDCNGVAADGCEAALTASATCGSCTTACAAPTPLCGAGPGGTRACIALCDAVGATTCGTRCVNTASTVTDCGMCDRACTQPHAAVSCAASVCVRVACDEGWQDCDGVAANGCERSVRTLTDCGGCGMRCGGAGADVTCATGTCEVDSCVPGRLDCDASGSNGCETDGTTTSDCGACAAPCAGGTPVCAPVGDGSFACAAACGASAPDACGGTCTDTDTDVANCGGCGDACALPEASAICRGGICRVQSCVAGRADCNGDPSDGCEVTLASDPAHCGGCGDACPSGPGASASCAGGSCSLRCDPGRADCDGSPATGCEASLRTLTDCRSCGDRCDPPAGTGDCSTGSCRLMGCDMNFGDCDGSATNGCEVDLLTARRNCGMCGRACTGMMGDCCNGICASSCP